MGCCLSTNTTETQTSKPQLFKTNSSSSLPKTNTKNSKSPFLEDKTVVKEVVIETSSTLPQPKQPIAILSQNDPTKEPLKLSLPNPKMVVHNHKLHSSEEFSEEVSEICSTTLSESNNNLADDSNDVTQIRNPSPAKNRLVGRDPNRKSDPSPGRVRPGPVRYGRGLNSNGTRRGGSVVGPDRRSRSPVTRVNGAGSRTGLSRCSSRRRMGKSPGGPSPLELGEKNPRPGGFGPLELCEMNLRLEQSDSKVENGGKSNGDNVETKLDPRNDESLENPLVSLECFIFL
ncbi:hypothetical protein LIER_20758 [Lithospermum erythrorhizon]|uniref:Uncharacterized protein n=1 Tax=Lithospermum erythrorhizon TaxID=34254 RepID=A0AAV3QNK5_LITER